VRARGFGQLPVRVLVARLAAALRAPRRYAFGALLAGVLLGPLGGALSARAAVVKHGPLVRVTLTTHNERYALKSMPSLRFLFKPARGRTFPFNETKRYQRLLGFGGAMTDSSAWLLEKQLAASAREHVMRGLFDPRSGIGLTITRVPIGASDFTAGESPYSYDDLPPGETDPILADFSIGHDLAYIIPALRQMLAIDPAVKVISTEWSPPPWMKANDEAGNVGGRGTLMPADYGVLGWYFARFIAAYLQQGIPIWAITPQNEPLAQPPYPGMTLTAPEESVFVSQDLVSALSALGLHPLIFGMDGANLEYAESLEQSAAASELAGIAWHCYGGDQAMSAFHAAFPAVLQITSECSPGIVPYGVSEAVLSSLNNGSSAVLLWNLALDQHGGPVQPPNSGCHGCTGLVTVNDTTHQARFGLGYYQLGQFSKFIHPGAIRVSAGRFVTEFAWRYGVTSGLDDVAAIDPNGTRVLVVYNNTRSRQGFSVSWRGQSFSYSLPAAGTVTFTWR
jgi:glucosylceramidase